MPDAVHTRRLAFTLPVYLRTPVGLTKMPEPMMEPTMTVTPLSSDIFASSLISSLSLEGIGSYGPFSPSLMLLDLDISPAKRNEQHSVSVFIAFSPFNSWFDLKLLYFLQHRNPTRSRRVLQRKMISWRSSMKIIFIVRDVRSIASIASS